MATYTSKFERRRRKATAAVGIGVSPSAGTADASVPMLNSGTGAASATDTNGSVWMRTDGVPEFRISSAWQAFGLLGTAQTWTAVQTFSAAPVLSLGASAIGGPLTYAAGVTSVIDVSACATGEADIVIGDNLASALQVRESTNAYLTFVTTNGGELVDIIKEVRHTAGVERQTRMEYYYDFLGDTGGTLPPEYAVDAQTANSSEDYVSGQGPGVYRLATEGTSEAQANQLFGGDALHINMSNNPIIEARIRYACAGAAPTADERWVFGLASAHTNAEDGLDAVVTNAWFRIEGASLAILVEADDGTTDTDDQDSTIVLVKSAWTVLKIDASDLADVKFYVDGVEQGGATVDMSALGANTYVQPILCQQRDAGTEVNTLDIDYIRIIVDR